MIRSSHRVRVSKIPIENINKKTGGAYRPWFLLCTCGYNSDWRFWRNAMARAEMHIMYPGVYR